MKEKLLKDLKDIQTKFDEFEVFKQYRLVSMGSETEQSRKTQLFGEIDQEKRFVFTLAQNSIFRVVGENHSFAKSTHNLRATDNGDFSQIFAMIKTLIYEIENDKIDYQSLARSEIFRDYLDMAEHLLEKTYKDAAAVIIGSTLEAHLKKLAQKNGIALEAPNNSGKIKAKATETLNSELMTANVYSDLDLKNVTAWLDLRNKAAHGHYNEYDQKQIKIFLQSVRAFIERNPA